MSEQPPPMQTRTQVEFGPEENRTFAALATNMSTVATLMNLAGLAFLIFFGLLLWHAIDQKAGYAAVVGIGAATLVCLTIGFQTYFAAKSFRRIVETQSRDVWHLMNGMESLRSMYGLLRFIILGAIVLLIVAAVIWAMRYQSGA
jgi:hypothetical protein